jgi:hypothetical protein
VSSEDSGVIDLFAMHKKATESSAAQGLVPPDVFSAPPPAFSTDLAGDRNSDFGDGENPFAKKPRKNLFVAGGIAGGLLVIGILVASFSGGSPEPAKASASGRSEPTTVSAPAPPPPPAPIVIAPVTPTEAPVATAKVPAPPTTGAAIFQKPPQKAGRAAAPAKSRAPATTAGGVKLTKVQSAGVTPAGQ